MSAANVISSYLPWTSATETFLFGFISILLLLRTCWSYLRSSKVGNDHGISDTCVQSVNSAPAGPTASQNAALHELKRRHPWPSLSNSKDSYADMDARRELAGAQGQLLQSCDWKNLDWDGGYKRFLRARNWEVEPAAAMLEKVLEWRRRVRPWEIRGVDMPVSLPSGTCRHAGFDRWRRPCVVIDVKHWCPWEYAPGENERFITYFCEGCISMLPCRPQTLEQERVVLVMNMDGLGTAHTGASALRAVRDLITVVQDRYPERLAVCIIINANLPFRFIWRATQPLINPVTREKIVMLGFPADPTVLATLDKHIGLARLPKSLGGSHPEFPLPTLDTSSPVDGASKDHANILMAGRAPAHAHSEPVRQLKDKFSERSCCGLW